MTQETIFATIQTGVSSLLHIGPEAITPTTRLKEDLNVDSMFMIEIAMRLEADFDIEIPEEDMPKLEDMTQIVAYVSEKVNANA
jgi:acyl carrier protein